MERRPLGLVLLTAAAMVLTGCLGAGQQTLPTASLGAVTKIVDGRPLKEFDVFVDSFTWTAREDGRPLSTFAFKLDEDLPPTVPAPEIRVTEGDRVRVTLHGGDHTIHWHGISVPWAMDGVPFMTQTVEPLGQGLDKTYVYEFNADETGTYWYHCHVDAPTHVDFGLFGAFIVEPRNKAQDPPFDREYTMLLHEIDSQSVLHFTPNHPENPAEAPDYARRTARDAADLAGVIAADSGLPSGFSEGPRDYYPIPSIRYHPYYDTFMINGKSFPDTEPLLIKKGEDVRIRVINAGQLVHAMHLHGHKFTVTHKDGSNLPAPYKGDTILIGPGERYDLYVNGYNPGVWDFHDHSGMWELGAYAANDHAFPGGMNTMLVYEDFEHPGLPEPHERHTSGDYMVFAREARGGGPAAHTGHTAPEPAVDAVLGQHLH